ncbi:MAG: prepilin-type N-terminal cleavage/methylation domain-containing protein [Phycisphaerales bacterium]|nr:MAG: prepilin-type N-terminal cleavage/methylation domain-containing protein [Phycisphaerales bacterium]
MKRIRYKSGFTLIELLVALVITGIIVSAVATLAFAMNSAGLATDDMGRKQAQVRFATARISDLIRQCRLVCYASADEIAVWRADDKFNDGKINIGELVYIEAGTAHDYLRLCEFDPSSSTEISLGSIGPLSTNWWSAYSSTIDYTLLMPECSNVMFYLDDTGSPPKSRLVSITCDVVENGAPRQYQMSAMLRGWAGNLLDAAGNIVSDDD